MLEYKCTEGQSLTDVCLNTYGSMDFYVKMLNDNNLEPSTIPNSGTTIIWDETLVIDQTTQRLTAKNKIIFATLNGFGVPEQINPDINMYKDALQAQYTATTEGGESEITIVELQGNEIIAITQEIQPLKNDAFSFSASTGKITLLKAPLEKDTTLFVLYKKQITS